MLMETCMDASITIHVICTFSREYLNTNNVASIIIAL